MASPSRRNRKYCTGTHAASHEDWSRSLQPGRWQPRGCRGKACRRMRNWSRLRRGRLERNFDSPTGLRKHGQNWETPAPASSPRRMQAWSPWMIRRQALSRCCFRNCRPAMPGCCCLPYRWFGRRLRMIRILLIRTCKDTATVLETDTPRWLFSSLRTWPLFLGEI